ncbi:hypothetical protein HanIR_Chr15g0761281 [Helianthus annuus]|nr:hypothetical protein HanIR_Chr15g0761281 [Helianthus annuus]
MCTVKIKTRYSTNDLNGSIKSINTPPFSFAKPTFESDFGPLSWSSYFIPEGKSDQTLRGPSVSILSCFSFVLALKSNCVWLSALTSLWSM